MKKTIKDERLNEWKKATKDISSKEFEETYTNTFMSGNSIGSVALDLVENKPMEFPKANNVYAQSIAHDLVPMKPIYKKEDILEIGDRMTTVKHIPTKGYEPKIYAMVGVPAVGKSYQARQLQHRLEKDGINCIIVSRDAIRKLLYGYNDSNIGDYYAVSDKEMLQRMQRVTDYEDSLIKFALQKGQRVILDSSHLQYKHITKLKYWNVAVELVVMTLPLKEFYYERDSKRVSPIGEIKIKRLIDRFNNTYSRLEDEPIDFTPIAPIPYDENKEDITIFDLDGTLCEKNDRHYSDMETVENDTAHFGVVDAYKKVVHAMTWKDDTEKETFVMICSGRSEKARNGTIKWFEQYGLTVPKMMFRRNDDRRLDWKVKEEMWAKISEKYNIIAMYDDRSQVVDRARVLGYKVFQVEPNNF